MGTIKIKSTDKKTQGDFVVINEEDFNPKLHRKLTEAEEAAADAQAAKPAKAEKE